MKRMKWIEMGQVFSKCWAWQVLKLFGSCSATPTRFAGYRHVKTVPRSKQLPQSEWPVPATPDES